MKPVSQRVPVEDYQDMLTCLKSHRRELVAFAQDPERKINKQLAVIENLEALLAAEKARLDELYRMQSSIDERIAAVDVRIEEVRQQCTIRSKMAKVEKLRALYRQIKALEDDCGALVTEDMIVS